MPAIRRVMPVRSLALAILGAAVAAGCAASGTAHDERTAPPPPPARINHIVLFDLRNAADADALIADSRESLGSIPGVVSLFCGKHVDAGRPAVMTDYDACVYVGFDSLEDYGAYVADARHQALVARWKDRLHGYRVYDVLDDAER